MSYSENEIGKVINLDGEFALLEIRESESCSHCHAKVVCSAGKEGTRSMRIKNKLNAKIDDYVAFDTSETQQLLITTMQYGFPLIGFLVGLMGYFYLLSDKILFPKEIGAFLGGILIMFAFGLITRYWSDKKAKSMSLHTMVDIIPVND